MKAVFANHFDALNPLSGLAIGDFPDPQVPSGWVKVQIKAAALNHHDLWTLKGQATAAENLPIVLGSDGCGITSTGDEVLLHAVLGTPINGDETLDPKRTLLSEVHNGTFAKYVVVPKENLIPKPDFLTFEQAACLPTAWLTAYRMLFTKSGLVSGDTVLIQGAGGGVATALIQLGKAAGFIVWVTSRTESKRQTALQIGADAVFEVGAKLPGKVDAVMESVGEATWSHSMRSLKPGGRIIVCGATSGANPPADLNRLFFLQLQVIGSTMGTKQEFLNMLEFLEKTGVRPIIHNTFTFTQADEALALLMNGEVTGKLILLPD
jgi:NADPH:quinone reductase-like Zn-dependent oxidoreductase